jgi:hypothetical protein
LLISRLKIYITSPCGWGDKIVLQNPDRIEKFSSIILMVGYQNKNNLG